MSETIDIKVAEATGPVLDWMVAKAVDRKVHINMSIPYGHTEPDGPPFIEAYEEEPWPGADEGYMPYSPSAIWEQGGPLIDRYYVEFRYQGVNDWLAAYALGGKYAFGTGRDYEAKSHLVAAMRAIVAAELGDIVAVPVGLHAQAEGGVR